MKSFRLGILVVAGVMISFACGGSKRHAAGAGTGGAAGAGGDAAGAPDDSSGGAFDVPPPVRCGAGMCEAFVVGDSAVAPCCADAAEEICGADLSTLVPTMGCRPLTQAGALDDSCPTSSAPAAGGLPLPPALGCCNEATGQCGYWISDLFGLLPFAPGCVDASSLGGGSMPQACGDQAHAGSGGAGGTAAGASSSAGAPPIEAAAGEGGNGGAPAAQ